MPVSPVLRPRASWRTQVTPGDPAVGVEHRGAGGGQLEQPGALALRGPGQHLVEVGAGADQAVAGDAGQLGPGQLQPLAAADDAQALVADPAVALLVRDAEGDELLDPARGEAVAAHLLARERGLLEQDDVEARPGEVRRGGGARRARRRRRRRPPRRGRRPPRRRAARSGCSRGTSGTARTTGLCTASQGYDARAGPVAAGGPVSGRRLRRGGRRGAGRRCPRLASRQVTWLQPAARMRSASACWSGQAWMDSAR